MSFNVSSAVHPQRLLHSTCNEVKSNNRSGDSLPFFCDTSLTTNIESFIVANAFFASSCDIKRPDVALNTTSL